MSRRDNPRTRWLPEDSQPDSRWMASTPTLRGRKVSRTRRAAPWLMLAAAILVVLIGLLLRRFL